MNERRHAFFDRLSRFYVPGRERRKELFGPCHPHQRALCCSTCLVSDPHLISSHLISSLVCGRLVSSWKGSQVSPLCYFSMCGARVIGTCEDVSVVRQTGGERRPVIESKLRPPLTQS